MSLLYLTSYHHQEGQSLDRAYYYYYYYEINHPSTEIIITSYCHYVIQRIAGFAITLYYVMIIRQDLM
jgi:hypothetical protein